MGVDPLATVQQWLDEATAAGIEYPGAMTVATATPAGDVSARMVLLRGLDERGLAFYTNRRSAKGRDIAANPRAAAVLHWQPLHRQVRVSGAVSEVDDAESDAYFAARPRCSQLSAWASPQSEVIADRGALDDAVAELAQRYPDAVPRPPYWGGYRIAPEVVELWTQRDNRLHDRQRFTRVGNAWRHDLLAP
jgi:pyridoxamine 5'-phosphate oxidase